MTDFSPFARTNALLYLAESARDIRAPFGLGFAAFPVDRADDPAERTRIGRFLDKNAYVGVLRLKRDFGRESSLGMIATSYDFVEEHNQTAGVDGRFRLDPQTVLSFQALGTTAPFSLAGAIAQQNAEILLAVVLAQLVQPGLPIVYCGRLAAMEPRTGVSVWGGVELGIASAGTVQIGHRYGFAVNVYGFSTNSHIIDAQNGFERALNAIIPALAGADEISGIGEMEAGVSSSYAQMVLDNEFIGSIQRIRKGFAADEDALAVEVIASVMDGSRNYLGQKHTMKHLKAGEVALTKLAERGNWEAWERGGKQSVLERAEAEAERILREHQVPPLDEAQERELDALLASAEKELK